MFLTYDHGPEGFKQKPTIIYEKDCSAHCSHYLLRYRTTCTGNDYSLQQYLKYLDNGTNQGTSWKTLHSTMPPGPAVPHNSYGDGDEAHCSSYGPNANLKYITTYFRRPSPWQMLPSSAVLLSVKEMMAQSLYINGTERFRTNMPTAITSAKSFHRCSHDGNTPQISSLPVGTLVTGTNVIAVEIHQRASNSSDISFDLLLTGLPISTPPVVSTLSPLDNATVVANTANLVSHFLNLYKGTGKHSY